MSIKQALQQEIQKENPAINFDSLISIPSKKAFYEWNGHYYREIPTEDIKRAIAWELQAKGLEDGSKLNKIFNHRLAKLYPSSEALKQGKGINCVNGVLELDWVGNEPKFNFRSHNSKTDFYFHKPVVKYDPDADPTAAENLLKCLDPAERTILLRTIAAAFDLRGVRAKLGRKIKSLFLHGQGNNGKDTLRECFGMIFGQHKFAGLSLSDFEAYDEGKRFNLSPLRDAVVNWAPEAKSKAKIDSLSCLKAAITGEELYYELKHQNAIKYNVNCLLIFNTNHHIYAQAANESFWSRFVLLKFNKTFSENPKAGELEANPRYKYDPQWVKAKVLPGLLNILIREFKLLMTEGIDFETSDSNWETLKQDTNHLWDFANEIGLRYDPNATEFITVEQLWNQLRTFYYKTDVLTRLPAGYDHWAGDLRAGDRYIRSKNKLKPAILELFPQAQHGYLRHGENRTRTSGFYKLRIDKPYVVAECRPYGSPNSTRAYNAEMPTE